MGVRTVSFLLTTDELVALTDCTQAAAQANWLTAHKWRYERGSSGRVKVARSFFEFMMGRPDTKVHVESKGINREALDRATRRA